MIERMVVAAQEARARSRMARSSIRARLSEEEHARRVSEARLPGRPTPPVGWTPSNPLPAFSSQSKTGAWEQDEVTRLVNALELYGSSTQRTKWKLIASCVGTRNHTQCRKYYNKNIKPSSPLEPEHMRGGGDGEAVEEYDRLEDHDEGVSGVPVDENLEDIFADLQVSLSDDVNLEDIPASPPTSFDDPLRRHLWTRL